jgi:hypothetical protein
MGVYILMEDIDSIITILFVIFSFFIGIISEKLISKYKLFKKQ